MRQIAAILRVADSTLLYKQGTNLSLVTKKGGTHMSLVKGIVILAIGLPLWGYSQVTTVHSSTGKAVGSAILKRIAWVFGVLFTLIGILGVFAGIGELGGG